MIVRLGVALGDELCLFAGADFEIERAVLAREAVHTVWEYSFEKSRAGRMSRSEFRSGGELCEFLNPVFEVPDFLAQFLGFRVVTEG